MSHKYDNAGVNLDLFGVPSRATCNHVNLDFDYYIDPVDFDIETIDAVASLLESRVSTALKAQTGIDPCFHIQTSHSNSVLKKDGTVTAKYSLRLYASNVLCSRTSNKNFVISLNKYFNENENELWDYLEVRMNHYLIGLSVPLSL